jgi:hypothetical protein
MFHVSVGSDQHAHSAAMFARRAIAQSLHHELAPKNIHVAHCVVDGMVDVVKEPLSQDEHHALGQF